MRGRGGAKVAYARGNAASNAQAARLLVEHNERAAASATTARAQAPTAVASPPLPSVAELLAEQTNLLRSLMLEKDKVSALKEANHTLLREKQELSVENETLKRQVIYLEDRLQNHESRTAASRSFLSSQASPTHLRPTSLAMTPSVKSEGKETPTQLTRDEKCRLTREMDPEARTSFILTWVYLCAANVAATDVECLAIVKGINAKWAHIMHPTACGWRKAYFEGKLVAKKRKTTAEDSNPSKIEEEVHKILTPLRCYNAIYSVTHAFEYVAARWSMERRLTRSIVYDTMMRYEYKMTPICGGSLTEAAKEFRLERYRLEYAYVRQTFRIHPELIVNFDESSLRMVPASQYSWCFKGPSNNNLIKMYPLCRTYTTITAAVSQGGKKLKLMVNWKAATNKVVVQGFEDTIFQNVQPHTHWNDDESLVTYFREVILPFVNVTYENSLTAEEKVKFSNNYMVVLDCAPVHISSITRQKLKGIMGDRGHLVFLPAGCTDISQPMDINCFGVVKNAARMEHQRMLTDGLNLVPHLERRKLLATTSETRFMCLSAISYGWESLGERSIKDAWEVSLGRLSPKRSKNGGFESIPGGNQRIDAWLSFKAAAAAEKITNQAPKRAQRQKELQEAYAAGKKPPSNPSCAYLIFRFGLPHEGVLEDARVHDAMVDAASFDTTKAKHSKNNAENMVVTKDSVPDDDDETVYEDVTVRNHILRDETKGTAKTVTKTTLDSDEDIDDDGVISTALQKARQRFSTRRPSGIVDGAVADIVPEANGETVPPADDVTPVRPTSESSFRIDGPYSKTKTYPTEKDIDELVNM